MAHSDLMALNGNFAQWQKTRGAGLTDVSPFNYYAVENFLKPYPIIDKEIRAGIVDKSQDGGIDAFYFFANRKYVFDDTKLDPQVEYKFNLILFQCKEGSGFSPVELGKVNYFADDLLDPTREEEEYKHSYHSKLRGMMKTFKEQYYQVAGSVTAFEVDFIYVTRLDVPDPLEDSDVKDAEKKLAKTILSHFSKAKFQTHYVGAEKLLAQAQIRRKNEKPLVYASQTIMAEDHWIALVELPEFYKFLQDDHGSFHEQMLEENVRGFQKKTPVNTGIKKTLENPKGKTEFWLLNNGITILTSHVTQAPQRTLKIKDPQIVNGLQTSRHIFDYYKGEVGISPDDKRRVLVRIIQTSDDDVRDEIINATNSQNKMPAEALRATEPIQRKIEEVFASFGLFYDRRKGHYKDQSKPAAKIVSVREVLQAYLAIFLRRPDAARARPSDYLNKDELYNEVYLNEKVPLTVHVRCTEVMRRIESHELKKQEHLDCLLDLQFYVALLIAARSIGNAHMPPNALASLNVAKIKDLQISKAFNDAYAAYVKYGADANAAKGAAMRDYVIQKLEKELHGKGKGKG